jgi:hypothetical protein
MPFCEKPRRYCKHRPRNPKSETAPRGYTHRHRRLGRAVDQARRMEHYNRIDGNRQSDTRWLKLHVVRQEEERLVKGMVEAAGEALRPSNGLWPC